MPIDDAGSNPSAAPTFDEAAIPLSAEAGDGVWRQGPLVVMRRDAVLPDRCLKSNEPSAGRLKRKLQWHHWTVYLALLVNVIVYIILATIISRRATIQIGLSQPWFARRRRTIVIAWTTFLTGLALTASGLFAGPSWAPWLAIAGVLMMLGGAIYGLVAARLVAAKRIDRTHIWLKGACPEFLDALPAWPGGT